MEGSQLKPGGAAQHAATQEEEGHDQTTFHEEKTQERAVTRGNRVGAPESPKCKEPTHRPREDWGFGSAEDCPACATWDEWFEIKLEEQERAEMREQWVGAPEPPKCKQPTHRPHKDGRFGSSEDCPECATWDEWFETSLQMGSGSSP
eukprot:4326818-Heterocapsa_arctica.AAC.1